MQEGRRFSDEIFQVFTQKQLSEGRAERWEIVVLLEVCVGLLSFGWETLEPEAERHENRFLKG
jgi:hypothetical protein